MLEIMARASQFYQPLIHLLAIMQHALANKAIWFSDPYPTVGGTQLPYYFWLASKIELVISFESSPEGDDSNEMTNPITN